MQVRGENAAGELLSVSFLVALVDPVFLTEPESPLIGALPRPLESLGYDNDVEDEADPEEGEKREEQPPF